MVHNDTVFLYTSHDEDDATSFKMLNWMLYTSTDMVNWRDHGVVASLENFKWAGNNGAWLLNVFIVMESFISTVPCSSKESVYLFRQPVWSLY